MTSSRVQRALVFLCASLMLVAPPRADERPANWSAIEIDSLRVTNARFSPNSDDIQDEVSFNLSFTQPSSIFVHVSPAGFPDTVAVLVDSVPDPRVSFNFAWDGIGTDLALQPEGDYSVSVRGLVPPTSTGPMLPDSTLFFFQRQVRIDVTPPTVTVLDLIPSNYAPLTLHEGVTPEFHLRVGQSQLEDSVRVEITDFFGRIRDTLPLVGGFSGDGDYVALCENCAAPERFIDGLYGISATAKDAAGNASLAGAFLDKNIIGPEIVVTLPKRPAANQDPDGRVHFQFADSLVGFAQDRQPVASVVLTIPPPADTTISLPRASGIDPTVHRFELDLSPLLTAEGVYDMTLTATDSAEVSADVPVSIVIDRTPGPPPTITPRPPPQFTRETLQFTVMADVNTMREVIIKGGVGPPDTLRVQVPEFAWQRSLVPGPNLMSFESIDFARNISVADTMTVVWETSEGLFVPERFDSGQSVQIHAGEVPARSVSVRIMALDGSLVRTFEDLSSQLEYEFPWDLTTPEGRTVKNGAYLVWVQVRYPDGRENRFRKMIAVLR